MLRIASLLVFSILIIHPKFSWADSFDYGKWSYNCMHDHTDRYGRVQNPRNRWAIICGDEGLGLRSCLSIFKFDERGEGLASIDSTEACEFTPSENAVDGKRIDLLPQNEQVKAVVSGNFITRRVWAFGNRGAWPYCMTDDVTVSLRGSAEVYRRLVELKHAFLGGAAP